MQSYFSAIWYVGLVKFLFIALNWLVADSLSCRGTKKSQNLNAAALLVEII